MASEATGPRAQRVRKLLEEKLSPVTLEIVDESDRHAGHVGRPRGPQEGIAETHFRLAIVSEAFDGVSRVARSRRVHALLEPEFADGLHALALSLRTPAETAAR
ncbi:BolA family protein [Acetobacter oeni]|uniref:BolA family transcriptional regulator n=1 Tax=Acetobacter oeni TaxID=304077 RepID=A0A511XHF4_9PROT|nr:BolA family protein [Acetobacter oeni]MBB3881207.1 BolA protein [Acetobacter oeni]NHO18083.1 BolA/IbaG family iron-sulfur metabolism protein [Acetobacter oeni]GBR08360.1 stress response and cell division protein BolA [Acetobacter oeni LMG 21952]GEN62359.1 BolA family transcriptional regulator [Acetobacter oeni]